MRKLLAIALPIVLLGFSAPISAQKVNYTVDTENSTIMWTGKKLTGEHTGTLQIKSGNLLMSGNNMVNASVTVDMTSIKDTDMDNPKMAQKLEGHLNSPDFFDTAVHPTATLNLTSFLPMRKMDQNGNNYDVSGELTIKGKTEKIAFPANIKWKGNNVYANGSFVFDRSKYEVRYGSKSFFDDIGDKVIEDNVTVKFNIQGIKTPTRD